MYVHAKKAKQNYWLVVLVYFLNRIFIFIFHSNINFHLYFDYLGREPPPPPVLVPLLRSSLAALLCPAHGMLLLHLLVDKPHQREA